MREERRKRRKRQQIITLVVCALVLAALIWGIATVVRKLTNYGNRSIASSQSDIQEDQPTDTSTADQTVEDRFAGVARNSYDAAGFYKEDGFLRYGDGTLGSEVGVDISSHQQSVDWEAVKAAGVDFAILRAGYRGYTEGAIQEDETFLTNLAAAKAAGLKVGVYFFSQALDKAEAVEEAEFVLNLLDGAELDYPIFFDWEDIEAEARAAGVTAFCSKPMFLSDLRDTLLTAIGHAAPAAAAEPDVLPEAQADFRGRRVLLVEDNELNREIAVEILHEYGFLVDTAENGAIAVDKVQTSPADRYDLVLMDIQMPVMDGYTATRRIRALNDPARAAVPIVAMTANVFEEERKRAFDCGMNGFLSKPLVIEALISALRDILH